MVTGNNKKRYFMYKGEKVSIPNDQTQSIEIPELSEWRVHLIEGVFYHPVKGSEPHRFHRFMHRLLLGLRWERRKP